MKKKNVHNDVIRPMSQHAKSTDQNKKFTCFVVGETSLLIRCAAYLLEQGHSVQGIFSTDSEINEWASQQGITCFKNKRLCLAAFQEQEFDYLFSIVNSWVMPSEALALPRKRAINFHDSILPRYAGVNATTHALRHAEQRHGISWHEMSEGIDTGDILQQAQFDISPDDTALSLNLKCYEAAFSAFAELVGELIEETVNPVKQNLAERSYYGPLDRPEAACVLNWQDTAEQLDSLIRALDMGAYGNTAGLPKCLIGGRLFIPSKTEILTTDSTQAPGTLLAIKETAIHIATGGKDLAIHQLLSIDGKALPAAEWMRNCDVREGQALPCPNADQIQKLTELDNRYCGHEAYWIKQLSAVTPVSLPNRQAMGDSAANLPSYTQTDCPEACDAVFLTLSFAVLLARLTQSYTFTLGFGAPALRQEIEGYEDYFAPQAPLNLRIDAGQTFSEMRQSFHKQLDELQNKGAYLYDLMLREPILRAASNSNELLSIVWVEDEQDSLLRQRHDHSLFIEATGGRCYWPANLHGLAIHFQQLITSISHYPDTPICQLPLLGQQSTQQLRAWNDTAIDYPKEQTIVDLFEQQAEKTPDNVAVIFEDQQLNYRELNCKSNQLAHYLLKIKNSADAGALINDNGLIAIGVERSLDMIIGLLAVLKAGAAYLPIDPGYPEARIGYILEDSAAPVLLTQSHLKARWSLDKLEHDCVAVCLDEIDFADQPADNLLARPCAEDLAYVIYTSGSTGAPKGVMVEHQALALHIQAILRQYRLNENDIAVQFASFSFDASLEQLFVAWLSGACSVPVKTNLIPPKDLLSLLKKYAVTVADLPPAYWRQMLDIETIANELSALRMLILGGEVFPRDLAEKTRDHFPELTVFNAYGPTESVITPAVYRLPAILSESATSSIAIGRPRANTRIHILDAQCQPQPPGFSGELCIAGRGLARGYLNRPELTSEKFIKVELFGKTESIYKTGDLARWLPDGNLEYLGRIDHQIKLRGFRIELGEIEAMLSQHPAVKEAVATLYEEDDNKRIVAYMATDSKSDELAEQLKDSLRSCLPDYMVPSHFIFLDRLPLTPNGKIDRKTLPAPDISYLKKSYVAPASSIEKRLANIWEKALNLDKVGAQDSFFDLGGNSLIGLRLVSEIQDEFNIAFGIHDLFAAFTVRKIAEYIDKGDDGHDIKPILRDGSLMPVILETESLCKLFSSFDEPEQLLWISFRLKGELDFSALQQAFDEMIRRHEPLRTSVIIENDEVFQRIEPFKPLEISLTDLSGLDSKQQRDKIVEIFSEAHFKSLKPGYMIDSILLKLDSKEYIFAYSAHYFSFDNKSIIIFNKELSSLYGSFHKKKPVSLPELSIQCADYSIWMKKQIDTAGDIPVYGELELKKFKGSQLPGDFDADLEAPPQLVLKRVEFDDKTVKAFESLTSDEQTSEMIVFTTVLLTLLHRITGKDNILIMGDFDYRTKKEVKEILGHYATSLYVCGDFSGNPSFNEMIKRTKKSMIDFYKNSSNFKYCKKVLDDLIFYPENNAFSDVCCFGLPYPDAIEPCLNFSGMESVYEDILPYMFYIPFYLHLTYSRQRIFGMLNYDLARFKPETTHRMMCQFRNIINSVAENADQPVSQIPLSLPEDKNYESHDLSNEYNKWQF